MASVWVARYNRWIERKFNIKGGPSVIDVDPNISVQLGEPPADERTLASWDRYAVSSTLAAPGAGNRAGMRIRNPNGSNTIAVLEKILVGAFSAADQPFLTVASGPGDLTSTVSTANTRLDNRSRPNPTMIVSSSSGVVGAPVVGVTLQQTAIPSPGNYDFVQGINQELPLLTSSQVQANGDAFTVYSNVLNQALIVTFMWRERGLETSELT